MMKCPNCGGEWNTRTGSCASCGLTVRAARPLRSGGTISPLTGQGAGGSWLPSGASQGGQVAEWWQAGFATPQVPANTPRGPFFTPPDGAAGVPAQQTGLPAFQAIHSAGAAWPAHVPSRGRPLLPGMLLRGGHYRLRELQERQDWVGGAFEATWMAHDTQRGNAPVAIVELGLPDLSAPPIQSALRQAAVRLSAAGGYPRIPALVAAFHERGRCFFAFEAPEGVTLLARMRSSGAALAEQQVIDCCLQVTDVLDLLERQAPPLVHGRIRPEHIMLAGVDGWQCVLISFSVMLAMQATLYIAGIERTRLSPYAAPELAQGVIDPRSDLYALLATAYHAVTGNLPVWTGGTLRPARQINASVSPQFEAVLSKGLQQLPEQRYQHAAELRQDLLGAIAAARARTGPSTALRAPLAAPVEEGVRQESTLLPAPEELAPLPARDDRLQAAAWLGVLLLCLIVLVLVSQI
jgi:hypothetical protein